LKPYPHVCGLQGVRYAPPAKAFYLKVAIAALAREEGPLERHTIVAGPFPHFTIGLNNGIPRFSTYDPPPSS